MLRGCTGLLYRQLMHLSRRNITFICSMISLVVFLMYISTMTASSKAMEESSLSSQSVIVNNGLIPSGIFKNTIASSVSSNTSARSTQESEAEIKKKLLDTRIQFGYGKYDANSTQGSLIPSLSNYGYRPSACMLMFLSAPVGEDIDHQLIFNTISSVQKKYNNWFGYPWVLISHTGREYEDEQFKDHIKELVGGEEHVHFETASKEYFNGYPQWIDINKISDSKLRLSKFEYGNSQFYRYMSRYFSGFFYKEEFMSKFDWYWKVEPGIEILCDVEYDVFRWMQDQKVVFGFGASFQEPHKELVHGVWEVVVDFMKVHVKDLGLDNVRFTLFNFLINSPDVIEDQKKQKEREKTNGETGYNSCQFSSEFQICNLNLLRSHSYQTIFDSSDKAGGIFYHRWSASVIQTIATSILLRRSQIYFFDNIGFKLSNNKLSTSSDLSSISRKIYNCPIDDSIFREYNCDCDQGLDFTFMKGSCTNIYYNIKNKPKEDNWDKHWKD